MADISAYDITSGVHTNAHEDAFSAPRTNVRLVAVFGAFKVPRVHSCALHLHYTLGLRVLCICAVPIGNSDRNYRENQAAMRQIISTYRITSVPVAIPVAKQAAGALLVRRAGAHRHCHEHPRPRRRGRHTRCSGRKRARAGTISIWPRSAN